MPVFLAAVPERSRSGELIGKDASFYYRRKVHISMNIRLLNVNLSVLITAVAGIRTAQKGLSYLWWLPLILIGSYLALSLLSWILIILISLPIRMNRE